ncbi:MAG: PAS domain S-box protein, partial [Bacteroidetes bacterium]
MSEAAPPLNFFSLLTQEESSRLSKVLNRLPSHLGSVRVEPIRFQANPHQALAPHIRPMSGHPDTYIIEFYSEYTPENTHYQQLIHENEQLRQEQERGRHILDALQKGSKGLLILNEDLSIYYFNAPVQEWINITDSDIGRPIHHFTFNIPLPGIADILVNAQAGTTTRLDDIISDTQKTLRLTIAPLGSEQAPARMVALLFQLMSADPQSHPSPAQSSAQKAFTESTPHPVYVLDRPLNRITYLALDDSFLGYTRAELLKMDVPHILSLIHPEDTDTAIDDFLDQAKIKPYSEWIFKEFRMKDKNGLWAWVHTQEKVSRRNPDGSIRELVGIIRDITEEKERELALKTRVKQLQSMIHFSGSAMAFISPDGFISESNFEAARLSNATAQGLKGSHFTESAAFVLTMDGKAQAQELCAQAVKTGEIQMYKDVLFGVRDETIRALSVSLKPLKNEAGTVTMLLAESQDTTHALQKQEEMSHKIELLRQIPLNMKGIGVLVVDSNLNFLLSKGPFLDQHRFSNIEGKNLYDLFPPEVAKRLALHYRKALSGETVQFEGTHEERSVYTTRIIPLTNARGDIYAAMAISQDITEMRQVQNAIDTVAHSIIVPSEQEFFDNLTRSLGSILDVNHVFIGEFHQETFSIHTPAYWRRGEMVHQFEYSIDGTPTQRILQQRTPLIFKKEAHKAFPRDPYLQEQKVEGYLGSPLFDSSEQVIGLLVVMSDKPIENVEMDENIIKVFTARAGAELERQKAQRALLAQEQIYRTLAQNIPNGLVIVFDPGLKVRMFEGQLAQFFSRDQ